MNLYSLSLELKNTVLNALNIISSWDDKTTRSKAIQLLLTAIQNVEFQIILHAIDKIIFCHNYPTDYLLQLYNLLQLYI